MMSHGHRVTVVSVIVSLLLLFRGGVTAQPANDDVPPEELKRRRQLKALAENNKMLQDPRGLERHRRRLDHQSRLTREGVIVRDDYQERRQEISYVYSAAMPEGTKIPHLLDLPVLRQVKEEAELPSSNVDEGDIATTDFHMWDRLLQDFSQLPTIAPAQNPTRAPLAPPTNPPIATRVPTKSPTLGPTVVEPVPVPTDAPISSPTTAPVVTTAPTEPPVATGMPSDLPSDSPSHLPSSVPTHVPTDAPVRQPTAPPVVTDTPVQPPTGSPVRSPTGTPIATGAPTDSPVVATVAPTISSCQAAQVIRSVALFNGTEFNDSTSYQSQALNWLCSSDTTGLSDDRLIQRYGLACIYYATYAVSTPFTDIAFGPGEIFPWSDSENWVTDVTECDWAKIGCNDNNQVTIIDLFSNLVTGEFPPEVVYMRSTLEILDLGTNQVFSDGTLFSPFLGQLTALTELRIDDTNFQNNPGVPTEIGLLSNLGFFSASRTLFRGPLLGAAFPSTLTELFWIELEFNGFNSTIPIEIGNLPLLSSFFIRDSFVSGNLDYMQNMPSIRTNWVDRNPGLTGTLPAFLGNLTTLGSFSLSECSFTGTLPSSIGNLRQSLMFAFFFTNQFTGTIPSTWARLSTLEVLELYDNQLTGTIPADVCALRFSGLNTLTADCPICPASTGSVQCCTECFN